MVIPGLHQMRTLLFLVAVIAGLCSPVFAANDRIATFLRTLLNQRSEELARAAAEMPADKYDFQAAPDNITFGYLVLHIADGNYIFCSYIGGVTAPDLPQLSERDSKEKLMERMKSSFDFCATAVASLDDSHMSETLTISDTKLSRAMAVLALTGSWVTHYEVQQRYLQLNGLRRGPG
jgi:hypothetical protein